jgi:hypothetical protein
MNSICCKRGTLFHFFAVKVVPTLIITTVALIALYFLGSVLSQDENLAPLSIVKNIYAGTFTVLLTAIPVICCLALCTQILSACYGEYMKDQESVLAD